MSNIAIQVNHVSKRYQIAAVRESTLRAQLSTTVHRLLNRLETPPGNAPGSAQNDGSKSIWALNDVSFELKQGEVLGLIGSNGSGKSTMLKILSRITHPTSGWVGINGRVDSLLGLGTGFTPDLTGRDNIYLNGAVLGLKRAQITSKFDEIVEFSEIGQFLDTPVKHYSSGMFTRLAFSLAVHLAADILLLDEVLAVGDAAFQRKSLAKMEQIVKDDGRTIIFVSHDSSAVAELCTQCIYLKKGQMIAQGDPKTVLAQYLGQVPALQKARGGSGTVLVSALRFLDAVSLQPIPHIVAGQDVVIEAQYQAQDLTQAPTQNAPRGLLHNVVLELAFFNSAGQFVTVAQNQMANTLFAELPASGTVYCSVSHFPLMEGQFTITATLYVDGIMTDLMDDAATIFIEPADYYNSGSQILGGRSGVYMDQSWTTTVYPRQEREQAKNQVVEHTANPRATPRANHRANH